MLKYVSRVLPLIALLAFAGAATAQTPSGAISGYGVSNGNLMLRESPPSGFFYRKGPEVGIVEKGAPLIIEGQKDVYTLFGKQEWLKVRPDRSADAQERWKSALESGGKAGGKACGKAGWKAGGKAGWKARGFITE